MPGRGSFRRLACRPICMGSALKKNMIYNPQITPEKSASLHTIVYFTGQAQISEDSP